MQTRFNPAQHGFHFSNNTIHWSYAWESGMQLCGGMSFAALDFYYSNMPIPPDDAAPQENTLLHGYINRRQFDAHGFAFPYYTSPGGTRRPEQKYLESKTTRFQTLKRFLDNGQPYPILLDGGASASRSHWVVAIGYDTEPSTPGALARLHVYDNNQPNIVRQLQPLDQIHRWQLTGGGHYYTFVPGTTYQALRPTEEEMSRPANAGQVFRGTSVGGHNIGQF